MLYQEHQLTELRSYVMVLQLNMDLIAIAGVINIVLKDQTSLTQVEGYTGINQEGDGEVSYYHANAGFDINEGGFINLTMEFRNRNSTNRSGNYTGPIYLNQDENLDQSLISNRNFFSQTGFNDNRVMEIGNAASKSLSFFFNTEIPISSSASFYGHGGRSIRNGQAAGFYRFPKDSSRIVQDLYPDGFSPKIHTDIRDQSITLGIKA